MATGKTQRTQLGLVCVTLLIRQFSEAHQFLGNRAEGKGADVLVVECNNAPASVYCLMVVLDAIPIVRGTLVAISFRSRRAGIAHDLRDDLIIVQLVRHSKRWQYVCVFERITATYNLAGSPTCRSN